MDLHTTLLSKKKLTYNSPLRKELYEFLKSYDFKTYNEGVFIYLNNLNEIPKCPFSGKNQYFDRNKYVGCSKEYYNFIKHDIHVKAKWLSWENLFKIGLSLDKAKELKLNKKILCARLNFPFLILDKEKIKQVLKNKGALDNVINYLLNNNFQHIEGVLKFIDDYYLLHSAKNNTLLYYLNRGYPEIIAKEKLYDFYNTWEKFKIIDKESERYKKWLESRKNGLNSVRGSLRSKFETKIYEELKNEYSIDLKFATHVNHVLFSKSKFKHDFLINDKLIVEYNGGYWHNDMFSDKRFNDIDLYKLELYRAKICIETNKCKYLILWESDIKYDINKVKKLINTALEEESLFFSSRTIDIDLYNQIENLQK